MNGEAKLINSLIRLFKKESKMSLLMLGQFGYAEDTKKLFVGNGVENVDVTDITTDRIHDGAVTVPKLAPDVIARILAEVASAIEAAVDDIEDGTTVAAEATKATNDALGNEIDTTYATKQEVTDRLGEKVDKVEGMQLSTNDFTTAEKEQIQTNAGSINDIADGTTVVKKAEQDADGNDIADTYETKANANLKDAEQDMRIATAEEALRKSMSGEVTGTASGTDIITLGKDVANAPLKVNVEGGVLYAPDLEYVRNKRVFKIEMDAGLMDFGVNTGTVTWYFPDGTTSTAKRPAKTLATAGTVYLIHNDFSGSTLQLEGNETNNKYKGSLSDLPALTYYLNLSGCSLVTGSLADLPPLTYFLCLNNCSSVTGSLADLPELSWYLDLRNCPLVTGAYTNVSGDNVPSNTHLTGTGLSATDMDNTLIAYAATTKSGARIVATGKTRTSASDAAVATLQGRGWDIDGIEKV